MATGMIKTADAGERTNALRRARINSLFVRMMRWLLPAVAVLLQHGVGVGQAQTQVVGVGSERRQLGLPLASPGPQPIEGLRHGLPIVHVGWRLHRARL